MADLVICINGDLGSGKSVVGRALAGQLSADYVSTGAIQRRAAARLGISTLELNERAEVDPVVRSTLDEEYEEVCKIGRPSVIDSRLAWQRIPTAFKVRLLCDPETAARRIMNDFGRESEQYTSVDDALAQVKERQVSERRRYLKEYGLDIADVRHYDLVVKTDGLTIPEVTDVVVRELNQRGDEPVIYAHPHHVIPTIGVPKTAEALTDLILFAIEGEQLICVNNHEALREALDAKKPLVRGRLAGTGEGRGGAVLASVIDEWQRAYQIRYPVSGAL